METTISPTNFWHIILAFFFVLGCVIAGVITKKIENRHRREAAAARAVVHRNFDFFQY